MPIKFRQPQDINAIRFGATLVWGAINGVITTIQGTSPLALVNAVAGRIKSLVQYGKCTTIDDKIYCNNGKLIVVDDELPAEYQRQIGFKFAASTYYRILDFHLRGTDTVRVSFSVDKACNVFGCYTNTSAEDNYSLYASTSSGGKYLRYDGSTYNSYIPSAQIGERIDAVITPNGTSGMPTDSVITPTEFEATADLCIGTTSTSASSSKLDGDIWGDFVVDDRLTLIPCKRLSDNVLGYYDLDSDTFYEPIGSAPTSLGVDTSHLNVLSVAGTPEVLTIGEQTASVANLLAVDDIKDEQDIISGAVTRRCEAVISDGTTPSGRYIGEVGDGNIIVKVRETGYEGDVATFEADRAEPLNGLTVNVEPIQDLHGYDSPWPAGGGVNLANFPENQTLPTSDVYIDALDFGEDRTIANCTLSFFVKNAVYENSGGAIVDFLKDDGTHQYRVSSAYGLVQGTPNTGKFSKAETNITFRTLRIFCNEAQYARWTGGTMSVQFELSATASDKYYPYSNICPISGRTSATVTRTGKNLFDKNAVLSGKYLDVNTGLPVNAVGYVVSDYIPVIAGNPIYIPKTNSSRRWFYNEQKEPVIYLNNANPQAYIPLSDGYIRVTINVTQAAGIDLSAFQIEYGSTASAYEPYAGNTYTIAFGDTVYGGTLDVTAGKMTVDRAMVDLGTLNWMYDALKERFRGALPATSSASTSNPGARTHCLCSIYKPSVEAYSDSNRTYMVVCVNTDYVWLRDNRYTDAATFKAAMSGVQLCYELATPFEITLTPTQIETLLGTNNIWADAGSIEAYVADAELIEHVTPQPMRTAEGSNTVSVTSAVDSVQLEIDYYKNE